MEEREPGLAVWENTRSEDFYPIPKADTRLLSTRANAVLLLEEETLSPGEDQSKQILMNYSPSLPPKLVKWTL
jgi:hypothetical protein